MSNNSSISEIVNQILAENQDITVVIVHCGEMAESEGEIEQVEEEKDSPYLDADSFWDAETIGVGGGGSPNQDAILMDNPTQS